MRCDSLTTSRIAGYSWSDLQHGSERLDALNIEIPDLEAKQRLRRPLA